MAHRDDSGAGTGLNDNASGTAALIELARSYAPTAGGAAHLARRTRSSSSRRTAHDGARGAAHFAALQDGGQNILARHQPRLHRRPRQAATRVRRQHARSPAPGLVETLRAALAQEGGGDPSRPSGLQQLVSLAFPFEPVRAGAVRQPRNPGGDRHDGRRAAAREPASAAGERSTSGISARSGSRRRTRSTRWSRASRSRRGRRATSSSASG